MKIDKETLDRIEELKINETLLYNCIEYLIKLWSINENEEEIAEHFEDIGFTKEDLKRLEITFG